MKKVYRTPNFNVQPFKPDEYCVICETSITAKVVCNISGLVFIDINNDGAIDSGEGYTHIETCGASCTVADLEDIYANGVLKRAKYLEGEEFFTGEWLHGIYWVDETGNKHASKSVTVNSFENVRS